LDQKQKTRLAHAEKLLELAEHSSEIEMRASLSRIYYAVYHVAIGLVGNKAHGEMAAALELREEGLGERYTTLLELRQKADYDPEFVRRRFDSLDDFRLQFPELMRSARRLYEDILQLETI
jgi:uncharacterized protein (UPF0332 family)